MARSGKPRVLKSESKKKKQKLIKKVSIAKQSVKKIAVQRSAAKPIEAKKKVSDKFIEILEKRSQEKKGMGGAPKQGAFAKPPGRRGRRPKNVDYTPTNNEDEAFPVENEFDSIEQDTGIRVKEKRDEAGYNLDRFEDFDEELNFDW